MSIELSEGTVTAKKTYSGSGTFSGAAGETLEIIIGGVHKLDVDVPEGKNWEAISINLAIDEVDA